MCNGIEIPHVFDKCAQWYEVNFTNWFANKLSPFLSTYGKYCRNEYAFDACIYSVGLHVLRSWIDLLTGSTLIPIIARARQYFDFPVSITGIRPIVEFVNNIWMECFWSDFFLSRIQTNLLGEVSDCSRLEGSLAAVLIGIGPSHDGHVSLVEQQRRTFLFA